MSLKINTTFDGIVEDTLPDKLHDLLACALDDLRACMTTPDRFVINMGAWHSAQPDGPCHVCLAGAVLANRLGVPDSLMVNCTFEGAMRVTTDTPYGARVLSVLPATLAAKMQALNLLRLGHMYDAAGVIGRLPDTWPNPRGIVDVTPFDECSEEWFNDMELVLSTLKEYDI